MIPREHHAAALAYMAVVLLATALMLARTHLTGVLLP